MQSDSATKLLLALILVCLVILIVQGLGGSEGLGAGWGRYQVTGMRAGAPVLIRTDTVTGQVWKLELRGGRDTWVAFHEPDAEGGEGNGSEAAGREPGGSASGSATTERDIVEPPGAPPLPSEPPRASPEVLAALPSPPSAAGKTSAEQIDQFAKALKNPKLPVDMRTWVAKQLGSIDEPASTDALLDAAGSDEPRVAAAALRALAGRNDERVRSVARRAHSGGAAEVRSAADALLQSIE